MKEPTNRSQPICDICLVCDICTFMRENSCVITSHGVATISRLLQSIGLFCRISSLLKGSFTKETYNFKEPTNRSYPIPWIRPVIFFRLILSHHCLSNNDENVMRMGWLRVVGSLKLQLSFAEYSLFYKALLQKRPIILRSLLIEATPYGVALISRLLKIIKLFGKRVL